MIKLKVETLNIQKINKSHENLLKLIDQLKEQHKEMLKRIKNSETTIDENFPRTEVFELV